MAAAELGLGGLAPPSGRSTASGGGGMAGPRRRRGSPTMQCCRIRQASGSESMGYISSQYGQQGRGKGKPVKCGSAALRPLMRPCMLRLHHGTMTASSSSRLLAIKLPSTSRTSFGLKGRPDRTGIGCDLRPGPVPGQYREVYGSCRPPFRGFTLCSQYNFDVSYVMYAL